MSEEIPIGQNPCPCCGGEYGEHSPDCRSLFSVADPVDIEDRRNLKIKQLWVLLEELAKLGVTIGISGGFKNGYSVRIKFAKTENNK